MKVTVIVSVVLCLLEAEALIIPDELPSILSIIYSNIPTLKKGTDSRLGWGFRLGDRADFQVLVELGPQTNTQPLANQGNENNKRATLDRLVDVLYAQRQLEKKEKERLQRNKINKIPLTTTETNVEGSEWIKTWSKQMKQLKEDETLPLESRPVILAEAKPGLAIGEIDAKSVIPDDEASVKTNKKSKATSKPKVITSTQEALDDVDLE